MSSLSLDIHPTDAILGPIKLLLLRPTTRPTHRSTGCRGGKRGGRRRRRRTTPSPSTNSIRNSSSIGRGRRILVINKPHPRRRSPSHRVSNSTHRGY